MGNLSLHRFNNRKGIKMSINEALSRAIYVKDLMDGTVIMRVKTVRPHAKWGYKQTTWCFVSCSVCGETYLKNWYDAKKSYKEGTEGWCSSHCRRIRTLGGANPRYNKIKIWKDGYQYITYYDPGNPKRKHMALQRVVMQNHLGRELCPKTERVHHIDMDKLNNSIDNLWICDNSMHMKAHHSMNSVVSLLMGKGLVEFNKNVGEYHLT